ncbi:SPOR domain-containing protein [soil metagenome]
MAKDYAKSYGKRKKPQKSSSNSGVMWLFAGLLLGLGIAGFLYINQNGVDALKNLKVASARVVEHKEKPVTAHKAAPPAKEETKQPQFDFYTILPNMNAGDSETNAHAQHANNSATKVETATAVTTAEQEKPTTVKVANATPAETTPAAMPIKIVSAEAATTKSKPVIEATEETKPSHKKEATKAEDNAETPKAEVNEAIKHARKQDAAKTEVSEESKHTRKQDAAKTEDGEETTKHASKQEKAQAEDGAESESHSKKEPVKAGRYVLQVGSFKSFSDADNLKAKLAMLGFEVKVKSGQKAGVVWHRVYLGAFANSQQATQIQQQLKEQQINSIMIKVG